MKRPEKPCVISCGILRKEIEHLLGKGDIDVEVHFLSERLHLDYNLLDRGLNGALKKYSELRSQGIIVVYGDVCLGFNGEMKTLIDKYDAVKVDGLNCIDCLLGGKGNLLEMDPDRSSGPESMEKHRQIGAERMIEKMDESNPLVRLII